MPALFFCVILNAITTVPLMLRPTVWMLLAVLLLVACDNGERQRLQLAELERQNRADSLMLNDSLACDLAEWFDRHGTRNEQMRAHYILGRTYADRGESPAALDAYNDAADRADTTAQDCDYHALCRVYAQEADLFFQQNLLDNYLSALDKSVRYAWEAKDTMTALNEKTHKIIAYDLLQRNDSVILLFNQAFEEICQYAGEEIASQYCMFPVNALLMENDFRRQKGIWISIQKNQDILIRFKILKLVAKFTIMLGVSSAYVSKMSKGILSELFKKSGSGKELTKKLSKFR